MAGQQRRLQAQRAAALAVVARLIDVAQQAAGVVELAPVEIGSPMPMAQAGAPFQPRAVTAEAVVEVEVEALHRKTAVAERVAARVVERRAGERAAAACIGIAGDQHRGERETLAGLAAPLQARPRMQAGTFSCRAIDASGREHGRAAVAIDIGAVRRGLVDEGTLEQRQRAVDDPLAAQGVIARPRHAARGLAVFVLQVGIDVVDPFAEAFAQHDVDRAGDRACAGLRGRCAQDLDALDLLGRDRFEREAAGDTLAIDQDLRESAAHAAQPRRAAAPGCAGDRHAGQALQDFERVAVTEALDLLAADDDLGGSRLAALLAVAAAAAGDFDALRVRRGRGCVRRGRGRCRLGRLRACQPGHGARARKRQRAAAPRPSTHDRPLSARRLRGV